MRGSTWIPWLLLGPLFGSLLAKIVHDATGWAAARVVAQVLLAVTACVIVVAFVANWRDAGRRERAASAADVTNATNATNAERETNEEDER